MNGLIGECQGGRVSGAQRCTLTLRFRQARLPGNQGWKCYFSLIVIEWTYMFRSYSFSLYLSLRNSTTSLASPFFSSAVNVYSLAAVWVRSNLSFTTLPPAVSFIFAFSPSASSQDISIVIV